MISGLNHPDISPFIEGLKTLFDVVSDEIFLSSFTIEEPELSDIFAKCYKVKRLALIWCFLKISPVFEIDWKIDYMIEELDLYMTWSEYDSKWLDSNKLRLFARALSKSWFTSTLKLVHVREDLYSENEVKKVLSTFGIKAKVEGDNKKPVSLS